MTRPPRPLLAELVDDVYYLEGAPPYPRLTLPPMPSAVLILNLGDPFRITTGPTEAEYDDGCVVTTPSQHFRFSYPAYTRSVGVHFKPWGLAPFIGVPASELRDHPVSVQHVWGSDTEELRDRLDATPTPADKLTVLENALLRRLHESAGLGLVQDVSGRIASHWGAVSIGDLSDAVGVSGNHLAHRFKQLVGITSKRLARTYRFARVVGAVEPSARVDWGELACRAGYFDQAHFIKEFHRFTGHTPTSYLDLRRRFLAEHPGHALNVGLLPCD